jgi:hypothetical protein
LCLLIIIKFKKKFDYRKPYFEKKNKAFTVIKKNKLFNTPNFINWN